MTRRIKQHPKCTRTIADHRRLCATTSTMENIAHEYQKRQAEAVNKTSTMHNTCIRMW
jgi:transcription elongation GreA/GreB family factor